MWAAGGLKLLKDQLNLSPLDKLYHPLTHKVLQ